jgi:mRNA interferase HigB
MKIIGLKVLDEAMKKHSDCSGTLSTWINEVKSANWTAPNDIKQRYPTASILPNDVVIFNIKGKKYRLCVKIKLKMNTIIVTWFGTHAEYDKKEFAS